MNDPVRLGKQDNVQPCYNSMEAWLQRHAILILTICIIVLFVLVFSLIGVVFFGLADGHFLSMSESNGYYYHLRNI